MNNLDDEHPTQNLLQTVALVPLLGLCLFLLRWFSFEYSARYVPERAFTFEFPSRLTHSAIDSPDTLSIDIYADGTVSIAGVLSEPPKSSELLLLRQHLRATRDAINKHGGLLVRPDLEVRQQRLIDVLSAVISSGIIYYGLT